MNFSDLENDVLLACPGVPPPLLKDAIFRTVWSFAHMSRTWRESMAPLTLVAGQHTYALTAPTGAAPMGVLRCKHVPSGMPLEPISERDLDHEFPGWEDNAANAPSMYFQPTADTIRVVYTPSENVVDALDIGVLLVPAADATAVPDGVFFEYRDALIAGARARLQAMPNMPWTSPEYAMANAGVYEQAVRQARQNVFKSRTRGPSRLHGPEFGF